MTEEKKPYGSPTPGGGLKFPQKIFARFVGQWRATLVADPDPSVIVEGTEAETRAAVYQLVGVVTLDNHTRVRKGAVAAVDAKTPPLMPRLLPRTKRPGDN